MSDEPRPVPTPLPKRPYRVSLLVNLGLAALLFLFSWALGGSTVQSIFYATVFFVVGTSWNWYRLRKRLARERE
jgi:Flp pilus assembly protein TadB